MNDCSNADIRDRLPDLLHDRLTVTVRDVVVAHVADCVDCREELELLRGAHIVLVAATPRVSVTQIVAALPKPAQVRPIAAVAPARRMMRMDWRVAAAVTFLAIGGSSVALLNRAPTADRAFADSGFVASTGPASNVAPVAVAAPSAPESLAASAPANTPDEAVADVQAEADVSPGGRFSGLTDAQMKALLDDIGNLPAVPVTEPEPVTIQVVNPGSALAGGL